MLNFEGELEEARLCKDITDLWSWRLNNFASYSIKKVYFAVFAMSFDSTYHEDFDKI